MAEQQKKPLVAAPKAAAAAPAKTTRPAAVKKPAATAKPVAAKTPAVAAPAAKPAKATKPEKPAADITVAKPVKTKLMSKSYTMSAADHAMLSEIKKSTQQSGIKIKKGELLSAALSLLAKLSPTELEKLLKKS